MLSDAELLSVEAATFELAVAFCLFANPSTEAANSSSSAVNDSIASRSSRSSRKTPCLYFSDKLCRREWTEVSLTLFNNSLTVLRSPEGKFDSGMAAENTRVRVPSRKKVQRNWRNVGMLEVCRGSECGACEAATAFSFGESPLSGSSWKPFVSAIARGFEAQCS